MTIAAPVAADTAPDAATRDLQHESTSVRLPFEKRVLDLAAFVATRGRLPSSVATDPAERSLCRWAGRCRRLHREHRLSADRAAALEAIPNWHWAPRDAPPRTRVSFDERCAQLRAFVAGNGRFPRSAGEGSEHSLYAWLVRQRWRHRAVGLTRERLAKLDAVGDWNAQLPRILPFEQSVAALTQFTVRHGRLPRPSSKDETERALGCRARHRRRQYREGRLSPERVAALERIPFWVWDMPRGRPDERAHFAQRIATLTAFVEANGRLPSSGSSDKAERSLGVWAERRRRSHARRQMPADRVAALQRVPLWAWTRWDMQLNELVAFVDDHARLPALAAEGDERRMACWVAHQRSQHDGGELSRDAALRLEGVPYWTWRPDTAFERRAQELARFIAEHRRSPSKRSRSVDERRLGQWFANKRRLYNTGRLGPDKTATLDRALADDGRWRSPKPRPRTFEQRVGRAARLHGRARPPAASSPTGSDPIELSLALWA